MQSYLMLKDTTYSNDYASKDWNVLKEFQMFLFRQILL